MKNIIAQLEKKAAETKKEMQRLERLADKTKDVDKAMELLDKAEIASKNWRCILAALKELKWVEE